LGKTASAQILLSLSLQNAPIQVIGGFDNASKAPKEPQFWWDDSIGSVEIQEHCLLL